jgi:hypothetical protein
VDGYFSGKKKNVPDGEAILRKSGNRRCPHGQGKLLAHHGGNDVEEAQALLIDRCVKG